jgi:hypothetical protein
MPVDSHFDEESGIWEVFSRNPTDVEELITALRRIYERLEKGEQLLLVWQGEGTTGGLEPTDIQRLKMFVEMERPPVPGRTALVGESDVEFGLARVAQAHSEGVLPNMRPFRHRADALAWLREALE